MIRWKIHTGHLECRILMMRCWIMNITESHRDWDHEDYEVRTWLFFYQILIIYKIIVKWIWDCDHPSHCIAGNPIKNSNNRTWSILELGTLIYYVVDLVICKYLLALPLNSTTNSVLCRLSKEDREYPHKPYILEFFERYIPVHCCLCLNFNYLPVISNILHLNWFIVRLEPVIVWT